MSNRTLLLLSAILLSCGASLKSGEYINNGVGATQVGGRDSTGQTHTVNQDFQGNVQVVAPPGQPLQATLLGFDGGITVTATFPDSGMSVTILNQNLNVTADAGIPVYGTGDAGNPDPRVVTVQGISNGSPVTVQGSVTANPGGTFTVAPVIANTSNVCTQVCCGTSATLLPTTNLTARLGEIVQNNGPGVVWVGPATVTVSNGQGVQLPGGSPGGELDGSLGPSIVLYCIAPVAQTSPGCTTICEDK